MSHRIPHLDLKRFTQGDAESRAVFATELLEAMKQYGFITLEGHAVTPDLIEASYAMSAAFFAQADTEKRHYAGALRGYTPFGVEHAKDANLPDLKEFWQIGHDGPGAEHPNLWPDQPGGFRETFEQLFDRLFETGQTLLRAMAIALELDETYFDGRVADGTSLLRLLHYPPVPDGVDPGCVRAAAHEDINLITMLVAAQGAGLEILERDGNWLPVENAPGHLIVDTGDMMARITNGIVPATTHRVVNPAGPNVSRYSMPFFVQPRTDVMLECLPVGQQADAQVPQTLSTGDFLNERLRAIGLPDS